MKSPDEKTEGAAATRKLLGGVVRVRSSVAYCKFVLALSSLGKELQGEV